MVRRTLLAVILLATVATMAQAQTWKIDSAHSAAHFAVRHMMVSTVRGDLGKITGTVTFDSAKPAAASIEASIDVAGIDTREPKRDAHLRSADFFDAATYPTIVFKSKSLTPSAGGGFKLTGDLTMHGVTKEVVLDVEPLRPEIKDQGGNSRTGTTATGKVNRQDFGVKWSQSLDGGGVVVSDEVAITLDVELVKPAVR